VSPPIPRHQVHAGLLKHLDDIGEADNTIVIFTTDSGAEVFTWPDGGMSSSISARRTWAQFESMISNFNSCNSPMAGRGKR
jgi:arylsulfatase A-like enzyme